MTYNEADLRGVELATCLAALEGLDASPLAVQHAREFLSRMVYYGARLPDEIRATETGGVSLHRDGHVLEVTARGMLVI